MLRESWFLLSESIKTQYLAYTRNPKNFCLMFHIYNSLRFWHVLFSYLSKKVNHGVKLNFQKLKSDSHFRKKNCFYLLQLNPFKNDEKWFLFHVKSFVRSWDR